MTESALSAVEGCGILDHVFTTEHEARFAFQSIWNDQFFFPARLAPNFSIIFFFSSGLAPETLGKSLIHS